MRYILDERVGCAAVIDTHHPDYDQEYPGLHSDTGGVVLYEGFANQSRMNISKSEIEDAKRVIELLKKACNALNDKKPRTKTEFVKCEFNHAWEAVKAFGEGEKLYTKRSHKDFVLIDNAPDVLRFLYDLHRKVETEIDERQEFIEKSEQVLSENTQTDHDIKEACGALYDAGCRFKLVEK
ncbi:coil containing protein [Vibrio phage 1.286.O._10N.286.55.C4]|nr:coil containing protein [Vibrio phage 1.286.O._10N.286.55.C4]